MGETVRRRGAGFEGRPRGSYRGGRERTKSPMNQVTSQEAKRPTDTNTQSPKWLAK